MLTQHQIIAYFEQRLSAAEREVFERELASDPQAQRTLADQENIHFALGVLLGDAAAHERVKRSIFMVLRGASAEQLTAGVMAETRARQAERALPLYRRAGRFLRSWLSGETEPGSTWRKVEAHPWRGLAAALAFGLLALVCALPVYHLFRPAPLVVIGEITSVIGSPELRHARERSTATVQKSTRVHFGDLLTTRDAERAEIRFKDGTTLRLNFNSAVELSGLGARDGRRVLAELTRPPEIRLLRGQVWTKVQKTTGAPQYAVRTEAATAVARGTEFGVQLRQASDRGSANSPATPPPLQAVLTVKEGAVDFFNSHGSVQATAMTESVAEADSAPTEPRRLQTLQVVRLSGSMELSILSSQLDWPEAASRLVLGGGWAGFRTKDFISGSAGANAGGARTNGVYVTHVSALSPAAAAGVQIGDVITAVNGQPVQEAGQVSRAVLLRPDSELSLTWSREGATRTAALTPRLQPSLFPGPMLSAAQRAQLEDLTQAWLDDGSPSESGLPTSLDLTVVAAARNNLGVLLEAEDALGPAVRGYARAVEQAPGVPLYRYNLGLALRKIGSFERASEELEAAVRLAPESFEAKKRLAEVQGLLGRPELALAQTEAALALDPQDHGLWELKAQVLGRLGRSVESTSAARRAVETQPGCAVALNFLGGALYQEGNLAEAERVYRQAMELAPFASLIHHNLGSLLGSRGQLVEAEKHLRRAIELQPDFVLAYRSLGDVLGDRRHWAEAESVLRRAAELDPEDGGVTRERGRLYMKQGRLDLAEAEFRRALAVSPHDPALFLGLGEILLRRRQAAEGERMYLQAIELDPGNAELHRELAEVYSEVLRDLPKAEASFRRSLELAPNRSETYSGLGFVMVQRGNLVEAETLLRRARDLAPDTADIHNSLGEVFRMRGNLDGALSSYRRALELSPGSPGTLNNLAIIHAMREEYPEAEKLFRALIDLATTNARINPRNFIINLAMVCDKQGKVAEAETFYRRAYQLDPDDPGTWNSLAWFLADRRLNLDEALEFAQRAVKAEPENPSYLDTLGWVHFQRGELDQAEATLTKALSQAGDEPPVQEIRAHLEKVQAAQRSNSSIRTW